jgi:uncharacterized protein
MATQKSQTATSEELVASVVSLLRYPVKSMMGEELNAAEFTRHGLLGDRRFALVDSSTGKVASAKNPRKWPNLFDYRATFVEPPTAVSSLPAVRITFPDGSVATTEQGNLEPLLSEALGREVTSKRSSKAMPARPLRRLLSQPHRPRSTGRTWKVSTTGTP